MTITTLEPSETILTQCLECDREFELTFEPKAKDMTFRERRGIDPVLLRYCPFCGSENLDCNRTSDADGSQGSSAG